MCGSCVFVCCLAVRVGVRPSGSKPVSRLQQEEREELSTDGWGADEWEVWKIVYVVQKRERESVRKRERERERERESYSHLLFMAMLLVKSCEPAKMSVHEDFSRWVSLFARMKKLMKSI